MPDTKPKTRNTKSTLSVGQALDKIRERFRTQPERELANAKAFLVDEAEWHAKVAARVPVEEHGALTRALASLGGPSVTHVPSTLVDETDLEREPADPDPVYTAERMQQGLTPERLAVARGSR